MASQDELVPSVCKYLLALPVCAGNKAFSAALAVAWPVPPLAIAKVPLNVLLEKAIVLLVSVSVVSRPTRVVVASGNVTTRPAVDTASNKVIALAAELELLKRMPLLKSVPSLMVTSPEPLG